jgi:hypothetical protein
MKRSVKLMGLVIFLSLMLTGVIVFAAGTTVSTPTAPGQPGTTPKPDQKCCIAGEYKGHHKDDPSKTCPKPGEGDSIMVINQDKGCDSKIWGTVKDVKDGSTQNFEGTVKTREKCCYIDGWIKKPVTGAAPAETTHFWGLLCKNKDGKWAGKGNYTNTRPGVTCNGKWEMSQM